MGFVYFIQQGDDGPIKVGWAIDPDARLAELQIACPDELVLLGFVPGTLVDEAWLQGRLVSGRIRGEWFRPDTQGLRKVLLYAMQCDAEQTESGRCRMRRVFELATEPGQFPPEAGDE